MNSYFWTAVDHSGKILSGEIDGLNKKSVFNHLIKKEMTPLSIKKKFFTFSFNKKITKQDLLDFTKELFILLHSGITLLNALTLILDSSQNLNFKNILTTIREKIINGESFFAALSTFPVIFNPIFCQMIFAGEHMGQLEDVLKQLIYSQERYLNISKKISKALFYPISVLIIAILISIGMLVFVLPQFQTIYNNFGATLPSITQRIIHLSQMIHAHFFIILLTLSLVFLSFKFYFRKKHYLTLFFKIPFFNRLMMIQQVAIWSQLLSMGLSAGIPLIESLQIATEMISIQKIRCEMSLVKSNVVAGKTLHHALECCPHFPTRAKHLISIAENADALPPMMINIAAIYQEKFEFLLDRLSKLLEPVIMILVALMISSLIIAMYLPIFRMGSVMG